MLEIRKNTFFKSYENSFFRDFSRNLSKTFKEKNFSGILIGSPVCEVDERLQIDALLITPDVICIIDFKNTEGKINLPDEDNFANGLWTREDGNPIKGGGSINPYRQLRYQKSKFIDVFDKYIKSQIAQGDYFDPFHAVRVVCFQERIELNGKIPKKEEQNFFIFHKENYLEGILDIVDTADEKVSLKEERSLDAFRNIFRANLYDPDGKVSEDLTKEIASESLKLNYKILYNDQKEALAKIESFFKNPEQQIFILQGTVNSGKSFLIPFIEEFAYRSGIPDTQIFAASGRIAKNLLASTGLENINSIYSYIYGGGKITVEEEIEDNNEQEINDKEEQEASDDLSIEIVPLKKCDNADNALFIVDEAHLVSDSYYKSLDLQFGTGQLLKDFLTFAEIWNKKRKIIFIGDSYQLQIGGLAKSALNPAYLQEKYTVKTESFSLVDKENYSPINAEALKCVNAIRSRVFTLSFNENANLQFVKQEDFLTYASNLITNKIDGHILCFGNKDTQKINYWIKTEIIKNGADIGIGDVVLFNNNISAEDKNDPFAPQKVYNGQFAEVIDVGEKSFSKKCKVKDNLINLIFREISLGMKESGRRINILSFENYRLSPKGELSENEIIAFKIILDQILSEAKKKSPFEKSDEYLEAINSKSYQLLQNEINDLENKLKLGEKVKIKLVETKRMQGKLLTHAKRKYNNKIRVNLQNDPSSEYYKLKNAAFLRFGWAITVHKSVAYKWDEVIFDIDPGEKIGKSNSAYFRWLYTGITRAREKILLIHYKPITPQKKQKWYVWVLGNGEQGITKTWADCETRVKGVPNAKFKSFETKEEAEAWLATGADYNLKHIAVETGIYFDAGTGGDGNVKIRISNEKGEDLIDNIAVSGKITNNFGELLACKYALELALKQGVKNIFGDSDLIIEYWSRGKINKKTVSPETIVLADEVKKLRSEFESKGGKINYISGGSNPADLGFHRI